VGILELIPFSELFSITITSDFSVYPTKPDIKLLSQWSIRANTGSNGRRLIVVEEVKVDKTR
jgi:hypothetical protein